MSNLAQLQRAQTKKETDAAIRRRAREKLRGLREAIRAARLQRKSKLREVGTSCRSARSTISARAKQARARLNESIKRTRQKARSLCSSARGDARVQTLNEIDKAIAQLQQEQAEQKKLAAWTRQPPKRPSSSTRRKSESREESDDEVAANIDDPGLRIVWQHVRNKIKAGKHRSRTEAFAEWAAEHVPQVYAIQEADAERHLVELERKERKLAGALRKPGAYRAPRDLDAVPF